MLDPATRSELRRRIDAARRERVKVSRCKYGDGRLHGTHSGYSAGCHCQDCRHAEKLYKRERRALLRELTADLGEAVQTTKGMEA